MLLNRVLESSMIRPHTLIKNSCLVYHKKGAENCNAICTPWLARLAQQRPFKATFALHERY